ncbi:ATP-binding protein [Parerythrobacter aurantius]|uniref:ATP-binding protein n=1 Tax=Parerythrobacter aurantius TaxID=3127706 RepID=UPI0032437C74
MSAQCAGMRPHRLLDTTFLPAPAGIDPTGRAGMRERWLAIALLTAIFALAAAAGIHFSKLDGRIAAIWVPNAIVVVALVMRRDLPIAQTLIGIFSANLLVDFCLGDSVLRAMGLSMANAVEIAVATALIRKTFPQRFDPKRFSDILVFLLFAGLIAPIASATIAGIVEIGSNSASWQQTVVRWYLADAVGMMLAGTSLLILADASKDFRIPRRHELRDWAISTIVGTVVVAAVFVQTRYPLLFLTGPIVLMHVFRHGALGAAVSTTKIAIIAIVATVQDLGPIAALVAGDWHKILVLEIFLLTVLLMGVPVAALLNEKRKALHDLTEREAQLAMLTDNASDAVMAFDRRGRCSFASAAAENLFARSREELVGLPYLQLVGRDDRPAARTMVRRLLRERDISALTFARPPRPVGSTSAADMYLSARCKCIETAEGSSAFAGTVVANVRDVTELVRLEQDRSEAVRRAEHALAAKGRFLANMSHEIRTPMNGVLGFAELLLHSPLKPDQHRKMELIVESGRSMMRILNDILDLSKIESGTFAVSKEPMELTSLLGSCVSINRALAEQKGLRIRCDVDLSLPLLVLGDQNRIRQVLLNLIGNAIKFTPRGHITVKATNEGERMQISVSDTGIGIDPEYAQAIFEPFEQGNEDTTQKYGGTGLGLSISANLARLMGGTLTVRSVPGTGSTFILDLPLVKQHERRRAVAGRTAIGRHGAARNRERILVADDNPINRELVFEMLSALDYDVVLAEDGNEAVATVLAATNNGQPFNLVLMDLQMPECDGCEAARSIRAAGVGAAQVPIVALSATTFPEDIRAAVDAGMQDHLGKPVSFEDLRQVASRWALRAPPGGATRPPTRLTVQNDDRLMAMWLDNRAQAIARVERYLAGDCSLAARRELERVMHSITGTAAQFGEAEFGTRAAALEAALRHEAPPVQMKALARDLLVLANPC